MSISKERAPLFEALVTHEQLSANAYHVPGHKQRAAGFNKEAAAYYERLLTIDLTELSDTDDLHHPQGPLAEAQELAAGCYQAEETCFLIGGSTSGNLAMILGQSNPGDLFIVQRNVHKSIIHGLILAGARAVILPPLVDPLSGLATLPSLQLIGRALDKHPNAKGLILTSPNYYGLGPRIEPVVELSHTYGIPVLVDEAHGAHFGFHPSFPSSALTAGADLVVQSSHKMLSAMTMGAMLHMQGSIVNRERVKQALRMVQSSSPSFPILASLDLARQQLDTFGSSAFESALEAVNLVLGLLHKTSYRALGVPPYRNKELQYDPLKLVLFDESLKRNGFELRDSLMKHHCIAEMADTRYVVMAFGIGSNRSDGIALLDALRAIDSAKDNNVNGIQRQEYNPFPGPIEHANAVPEPVLFTREMNRLKKIRLEDSLGCKCAEWVIPYPPGIPLLYPGEVITAALIEQLQRWRQLGAQIQGPLDPSLMTLQVYE